MPVFDLDPNQLYFPPAHFAGPDGFLARGGRVDARWLEYGYLHGYYVWHNPMRYPDWYSPDPRLAMETEQCQLAPQEGDHVLFFDENPESFLKFMQKQVNKEPMNNFWISGMLVKAFVDLHKEDKALFMVFNDKNNKAFGYAFGAVLGLAYFGEYILSNEPKRVVATMLPIFKEYDILLADFHKPSNQFNPEWCQPMDRIRYLELLKQYTE